MEGGSPDPQWVVGQVIEAIDPAAWIERSIYSKKRQELETIDIFLLAIRQPGEQDLTIQEEVDGEELDVDPAI